MARNKKDKQPRNKFKRLVKKYEDEYNRIEPLLTQTDGLEKAKAVQDLEKLRIDAGNDRQIYVAKSASRAKFAKFGLLGSVLGTVLISIAVFYALSLAATTLPGFVALATLSLSVASIFGFGIIPFLMARNASRKAKKLSPVADKTNIKHDELHNIKSNVKTNQNLDTNLRDRINQNTNTLVTEDVLENVPEENAGVANKSTKKEENKSAYNPALYTQQNQPQAISASSVKQDDETPVETETVDPDYTERKSGTLTDEEWKEAFPIDGLVIPKTHKGESTKYKCRVELKQFGEKKAGPITSKILNITADNSKAFLEALRDICDKKTNSNKLATATQLCANARDNGLKAQIRLVMTDLVDPKKIIRTEYKNENEFTDFLDNLREQAIEKLLDKMKDVKVPEGEEAKIYYAPKVTEEDSENTEVVNYTFLNF